MNLLNKKNMTLTAAPPSGVIYERVFSVILATDLSYKFCLGTQPFLKVQDHYELPDSRPRCGNAQNCLGLTLGLDERVKQVLTYVACLRLTPKTSGIFNFKNIQVYNSF